MGGISFLFYNMSNPPINMNFTKSFMKMKSRGQDDTQVVLEGTPTFNQANMNQITANLSKREIAEYKPICFHYGYHRMSINDLSIDGSQPFDDPIIHKIQKYPELRMRPKRKLLCNGEIYNYNELVEKHNLNDKDLQSKSDVEIIMPLYIKHSQIQDDTHKGLESCLDELNGDYSFILTENTTTYQLKHINIFAVRDCFGTKPLYMIKYAPKQNPKNEVFYMFVSEIKGVPKELLYNPDYIVKEIPPGSYWSYQNSIIDKNENDFIIYNNFSMYKNLDLCTINKPDPQTISSLYSTIKSLVINNVRIRFDLSHQNVGVLLSGGFDSCIILGILVNYLYSINYDFLENPLHVFTIGDSNNKDVVNATKHVESLEKNYNIDIHHHIINIMDFDLIASEIENIVECLETFDSKTIQKSIPMFFLLKYISEKTNVKVLLSGEGLDELCGYSDLFNLNDLDFQTKSIDLLNNLSKYELLRSDKISGSMGLELRYPFLDKIFVEYILTIHPLLKRPQISSFSKEPIEKYIIRKAFDNLSIPNGFFIDRDILWASRQDINSSINELPLRLHNYYDTYYTDIDFFNCLNDIIEPKPNTKEDMHYRKLFDKIYPNTSNILNHYWNSIWKF